MTETRSFKSMAVIGAGTMGSGIAQKLATEGYPVVLIDMDDARVETGVANLTRTLEEGVERRIFKPEQAEAILGRIHGTSDWSALADVDLVIEAVFEERQVKDEVFAKLEAVCRADAILATNTSSFSVTDLAARLARPERVVGLHYFFHPAKNRLVEVVPGARTDPEVLSRVWALQEQIGKIPIATTDSHGFIINRFFAVWLNEAIRLVEQGVANVPTVEAALTGYFRLGMGPFALMNATSLDIAMHTCNTLGNAFGPFYAPAESLCNKVAARERWDMSGDVDESLFTRITDHVVACIIYVAAQLVEEGVGTIEDVDIGARVGLRWPQGPFELANRLGTARAAAVAQAVIAPWGLALPRVLSGRAATDARFTFELVRSRVEDGIATLTINRPDTLNAVNEEVISQLEAGFAAAVSNPDVRGIVIAGTGKAFVAGADIRFFIRNIENQTLEQTVAFTRRCQDLWRAIDVCEKPVVARLHGLALGGGLELAMACDHIVAAEKAVVALPETGIGIYPGLGGTQRTTRRVGVGLARYLVLTGEMLSARAALEIGLVDRVVAANELDAAVREAVALGVVEERTPRPVPASWAALAEFFAAADVEALLAGDAGDVTDPAIQKAVSRVTRKGPVAVRVASDLIERGAGLPLAEALPLELEQLTTIFGTHDALLGLKSVGGPPPEFTGR